jgi:hypothetical protein
MKIKYIMFAGITVFPFLTGCISNLATLPPVGPGATSRAVPGENGYLEVFSATEKSLPFASDDNTCFNLHSGYDIYDEFGKEVEFVPNHASNMDEWPDKATLAAGKYNIVVESDCCGLLRVPVIIQKGKTTIVHLDSGWNQPANASPNQIVTLPNGEAVGWRSGAMN